MWFSKKTVWCLTIYLAFGLGSARHHHYRRGGETIQNANEHAHLQNHEVPPNSVRPKRESFVDLNNIPNIMRGFAQNLGRGLNSMVQHSQKIASQGHKVVSSGIHSMMHNMPTIIYGNWKPISSPKPSYPVHHPEGSYMSPPPTRPPTSYIPAVPEPYPKPFVPPYTQPTFQPILEPAKPIYTIPEPFVKPEPVYVQPAPTPGPTYIKPFENEVVQLIPEYETGFLLDPEPPKAPPTAPPAPSPSPTPAYVPIVPTIGPEPSLPVMSHGIPEEYSQNPDHIHKISGHTLWYKDLKKLKGKSKMVEGELAKYRPRPPPPGPSLRLLRSH